MTKAKCPFCGNIDVWIEDGELKTANPMSYSLKHCEKKMKFRNEFEKFLKEFQKNENMPNEFSLIMLIEMMPIVMFTEKCDEVFENKS